MPIKTKITEAKTKMAAMFAALPFIADSETWFYIAGGIGAVSLAIGFVAALAGLVFGWRANTNQKRTTQIEIAKVETNARERIATVESKSNERIQVETAKVRADADTAAKRIEIAANEKIEAARNEAGVKIAEALERTRKVEVSLAKQQARAAKAEKDLLELQERLDPRKLTSGQRAKLVEVLSRNRNGVFISCKLLDKESCAFAEILASVLRESKWDVLVSKTSVNYFVGFTIFANTASGTLPGLDTLLLAFKEAGISHQTNRVPENSIGQFPPEVLFLVVGTKE